MADSRYRYTEERKGIKSSPCGSKNINYRTYNSVSKISSVKPKVEKYTQGVGDSSYKEVVHVSPTKLKKIKELLKTENDVGNEIDMEVN
jgi:hypothetical protein